MTVATYIQIFEIVSVFSEKQIRDCGSILHKYKIVNL